MISLRFEAMVALWEEFTSFTGNHNHTLHTPLPCFSNAKNGLFCQGQTHEKKTGTFQAYWLN